MSDFSRELVIKVTRDDSEYLAKTKATYAAELQLLEKLKAAAKSKGDVDKAAEKAKADAAKEADQLIKQMDKAAADRQKADAKAKVARARETSQAVRQADKVMSDLIMSDLKALTAADAAMAKARKESAAEVAKVVRQVEAQSRADARQWDRRELTDEEVQQRALSGLIRKANRDRVQDLVDSHGKEKGIVADVTAAWNAKLGAIRAAGPAVAGLTVGMAGLRIGAEVLDALDEKTKRFIESTREATRAVIAQHKAQLELAGFAGAPGDTGPELEKSAKLAASSGLSISEATEVRKAAEAGAYSLVDKEAIPAQNGMPAVEAQQGAVSRPVYDEGTEMAAKMAAYSGGNPSEYGKGVGTIINLEGRRIDDAKDIENRLLQYDKLANIGKFETASGLFEQVDRNLPFVKSGVISGPDMAGLTALYAQSNQAEAATFAKQAITAVSGGLMMGRGINIDDAFKADATTTSGYFQDIGITQQDEALPRLFKVIDDIRAQKSKAQAAGQNFNPDEYLIRKGFGNIQLRQALLMAEGGADQLRNDILPTLDKLFTPGTIGSIHANYIDKTLGGRGRAAEAGGEIATAVEGAKFGNLNTALESQFNLMKARGEIVGKVEDYMTPLGWNPFANIGRRATDTVPNTLLDPLAARLEEELARSGQSLGAAGHVDPKTGGIYATVGQVLTGNRPWEEKAAVFNDAQARIQGAGGDPSLGMGKTLQEMVELLKGVNDGMKQVASNTKGLTPRVPIVPNPAPARIGNPY